MAAVQSQEEHSSWLENSFMSAGMKCVDILHSAKRSHCSSVPHGKRKTAKLGFATQKDDVSNASVHRLQQDFSATCNNKTFKNMKQVIASHDADEKKEVKAVSQLCSVSDNDSCVSSVAGGNENEEICSFSKEDQSTMLIPVFID